MSSTSFDHAGNEIEFDERGTPYKRLVNWDPKRDGNFLQTPYALLAENRLTSVELRIYQLLVNECHRTQRRTIRYSYARFKAEVTVQRNKTISHNTIKSALDGLVEFGFLTIHSDGPRASDHTEVWYTPTPFSEAEFIHLVTEGYIANNARIMRPADPAAHAQRRAVERIVAAREAEADPPAEQCLTQGESEIDSERVSPRHEASLEVTSKNRNTADHPIDSSNTQTVTDSEPHEGCSSQENDGVLDDDELREFLGAEGFAQYQEQSVSSSPGNDVLRTALSRMPVSASLRSDRNLSSNTDALRIEQRLRQIAAEQWTATLVGDTHTVVKLMREDRELRGQLDALRLRSGA